MTAGSSENGPRMQQQFSLQEYFPDGRRRNNSGLNRINPYGDWEIILPQESLKHGDLYKLSVHWEGGQGERIPSYATRLVQDDDTKIFSAQVWHPEKEYHWSIKDFKLARYSSGDL